MSAPIQRALGNRVWLLRRGETPLIQKVYRPRRGRLRALCQIVGTPLVAKTWPTPRGRRTCERRVLRAWREAGFDVPADLTDRYSELAADDRILLEAIEGPSLHALIKHETSRPARDAWLERFACGWSRRHALAVRRGDSLLVQEHGSFRHVLVQGERLVTIDHEQAYVPGTPVLPLILREVLGYLRTLSFGRADGLLPADLSALLRGYEDPQLLLDAARAGTRGPGAWLARWSATPANRRRRDALTRRLVDAARSELRRRQRRGSPDPLARRRRATRVGA